MSPHKAGGVIILDVGLVSITSLRVDLAKRKCIKSVSFHEQEYSVVEVVGATFRCDFCEIWNRSKLCIQIVCSSFFE